MCPANLVGRWPVAPTEDRARTGQTGKSGGQPDRGAEIGAILGGRYRLGARLGQGAEGETFNATDERSGAEVAVKIFRGAGGQVSARVRSEFEKLRGHDHPGVVRPLDVGREGGRLFLVMELVTGTALGAIAALTDESQRRSLFVRAAREITDALAFLHGRGVVHGDVAPENVRLAAADGRAVLIDLGGAGFVSAGAATGTLGFAAPEALIGRLGPASDLFSLGATLFHAWTGNGPFGVGAESVPTMLAGPAPPLSSVRAGLPTDWDRLIAGLLETAPERRFSSARVVLGELDRLSPASMAMTAVGPGAQAPLLPPYPAGDPLAGIFVGRRAERASLQQAFALLAEGLCPHAAIAVVGNDGSGRSTLMDRALQDLAIAQLAESAPPIRVYAGLLAGLADGAGLDVAGDEDDATTMSNPRTGADDYAAAGDANDDPVRARQRRFAALAAALERWSARSPIVAALDAGAEEEAFASFVAGAPASGRWLVLTAATRPLQRVGALDLTLPPLGLDDAGTLVERAAGAPAPVAAVARLASAAAGHAATLAVLARQLVESARRGEGETFSPQPNLALDQILTHSFRMLPPNARRLTALVELGLYRTSDSESSGDAAAGEPPAMGALESRLLGVAGEERAATAGNALACAVAAGWLTESTEDDRSAQDGARTSQRAASVVWRDDRLRLPSPAHRFVCRRALADADLQPLVDNALAMPHLLADGARGICLEARGDDVSAAQAYLSAAARAGAGAGTTTAPSGIAGESAGLTIDAHAEDDRLAAAVGWLEEAARLAPASLNVEQRTTLVTSLVLQGRSDAALALLDIALAPPTPPGAGGAKAAAARPGDFPSQMRLLERKAWLLTRGGDPNGACRLLQHALASLPADTSANVIDPVRARLARVLVSLGRFSEASAVIATIASADSPAGALATETAILARAYGGDLAAARRLYASWIATPGRIRAAYLAALLDHLSGDLLQALATYRRALSDAEATGDIHTLAAIALNMGALAAEAGQYDEALVMHDRAIRELGRLGATTELCTALFNAGMTWLDLGDLARVRSLAARLRTETASGQASSSATPSLSAPSNFASAAVTYLEAELALRQGDGPAAAELFARASMATGLDAALGRAARLARAELLATSLKRPSEAQAALDALAGADGDPRSAADLRLARARVVLAGPALDVDTALPVATDLQEDATAAAREGRRPRAWRAALTSARLFHRAAQVAPAAAQMVSAQRLFEEVRMSTPVDHRHGLDQDPDARFLNDLSRMLAPTGHGADQAQAVRASRSEDRLRRLLRINKRLNGELRLPRLLELIMDTIIELTEAERGFILLEDDKGELAVKVARNIDQQTLETGAFDLSRSIARQAAAGGAPVVTIDAAGDPRFREALSVSNLDLRSVLAVPLHVKGRAVGTLYVDNRLRKGAFGDDDVQLVLDFAEQAGIAIENARLLSELRRRERQIEVLNRRLQGELAVRKEELVGMKQELRENREALAIRYDYRNIVGRTPRMLDLFRLLDRLTDTTLPVVIQGESGTGKELVARALHFNGPRRERPFVSENCAAIPETLLESTLFGAVRGAYTGADHDSRGLFEVADGGTLFLDEVGEMSAAMQGKLLRVLQTGELRRVGSERTRKVDVRVVAATNRDLARMVEEGRFRQDLFFRLSVAPIALPPLRERRDDIPAIVKHVLDRLPEPGGGARHAAAVPKTSAAKDAPVKRVTAPALARLCAYRWPGNVRELENELMRAAALSDGDEIDVGDLSPHVAGDAETALTALTTTPDDPDSLMLRPRVERLERALLREALSRSGGNQTRAAAALGLSRFGLQKKLHRYQMG